MTGKWSIAQFCAVVALAIGGPSLAAFLAWHYDLLPSGNTQPVEDPMIAAVLSSHHGCTSKMGPALPESIPTGLTAHTDQDNVIQLRMLPFDPLSPAMVREADAWLVQGFPGVVRLDGPNVTYNCHGWIVAGGRYWIEGPDFELILHDNGYHPVPIPQLGDIVVYRDGVGEIVHSGLVREVSAAAVSVESKWGVLQRVLHAVGVQPFSAKWTYYRTERPTHFLHLSGSHDSARHAGAE
jgi:hypothetical protein